MALQFRSFREASARQSKPLPAQASGRIDPPSILAPCNLLPSIPRSQRDSYCSRFSSAALLGSERYVGVGDFTEASKALLQRGHIEAWAAQL